jgi:hypothetical protein
VGHFIVGHFIGVHPIGEGPCCPQTQPSPNPFTIDFRPFSPHSPRSGKTFGCPTQAHFVPVASHPETTHQWQVLSRNFPLPISLHASRKRGGFLINSVTSPPKQAPPTHPAGSVPHIYTKGASLAYHRGGVLAEAHGRWDTHVGGVGPSYLHKRGQSFISSRRCFGSGTRPVGLGPLSKSGGRKVGKLMIFRFS